MNSHHKPPTHKVTFHKSKKSYYFTDEKLKTFQLIGIGLEKNYSVEVLSQ